MINWKYFILLSRYITGNNKEKEKIKMTVPVRMLMEKDLKKKQMCFYLPKIHQKKPPKPLDNAVYIEQTPETTFYVYRFGG